MILYFLLGGLAIAAGVIASYAPAIKASMAYYPLGIGLAMINNYIWLKIAKSTNDSSKLLMLGVYWDSMIVLSYVLLPVIFFGARAHGTSLLGIVLIVVGMMLTKIGG